MGKIRNRVKKEWNGPHGCFYKFAVCATALGLFYAAFISSNNLFRWAGACIELRQQRLQIEKYRREISEMDKQIRMLSTDRDTLEEFARERFHFAAPGDDVYLLGK